MTKRNSYIRPLLLLFLLISSSALCLARSSKTNSDYHVIIPEFSSPPNIDGKLENPLWKKGAVLDSFTQYEPLEGSAPSEKTVVYIAYDKNNLYIAVRCFDSNPKAIRASLTQRDNVIGDDEVTIYLDTFNDKKRAFTFQVNPLGVQSDGIYTEIRSRYNRGGGGRGGFNRIDKNWDTFFLSDASVDDLGYLVELSIPFKSLRFPNTKSQVWGLQIQRNIRRKNEEIYWYPRSRDVNGFLVQSGTVQIDGVLDKGKNLEIMPVVTGIKESGNKFKPEPSLNLKYGITSDLTADLTVNPDFSQLEADMPQIDVNQRYALYFPEKRPFFLEGKDLFDTPIELLYTRTIRNPIWGTKLTGKIGKTTLGFLSAYDENPTEIDIPYESNPLETLETQSLINIFRLKQDLFQESYIGFILTDKELGTSLNSITQNYNRVAGIDGHFKFNKYYRFSFQVVGSKSKVGNDKTAVVPAMNFNISHNSRHWSLSADYIHLPEDFEGSLGFFRRKDIHSFRTNIGYNFLPQNNIVVDIRPSIEYRRAYDFNNTLTDEEFRIGWFISGWRGSHIFGGFTTELERYEGIDFHKKSFRTNISSQPFSWFNGNISFSFGDGIYYSSEPYLGYKTTFEIRTTFKPLANLRVLYNLENDKFYKSRGGEKVYSVNIISQRISYQLSRTISLRLITDYNDYDKRLFNSILLSYEYRPGTVFYLGIDDTREKDEAGIFKGDGKYYFVKFSYWWRI